MNDLARGSTSRSAFNGTIARVDEAEIAAHAAVGRGNVTRLFPCLASWRL